MIGRPRVDAETRFFRHVEQSGDCWLWTTPLTRTGYAQFSDENVRPVYAHRWSYEHFRADLSPGLVIDHLCRVRNCVNPWHMEPVTPRVNTLRGEGPTALLSRRGALCKRGHSLPADGNCHECRLITYAAYRSRKKTAA